MNLFQAVPMEVEAVQVFKPFKLNTPLGIIKGCAYDWIITVHDLYQKGVGIKYVCRNADFERMYKPVNVAARKAFKGPQCKHWYGPFKSSKTLLSRRKHKLRWGPKALCMDCNPWLRRAIHKHFRRTRCSASTRLK